ncbi:MAG: TadE/TadG family type IV pilus assembly protein [Brevibacterium aurantiacum]|uniref:TadE-like protein n=1 Tax=Brevibacterium aurantiacum TaxID=273384 RepID=A0A2H1J4H1_BREAU|nr:TadE/TadG family type IV pilus assembly protein [Brevibacterium aurantiacum]MDN5607359.1 pilus assembly protein [Brevibacterium sp.]AZL13829.1 TadE family protein [Brevibacterium aurantiacum]MDN6373365.1 pilus assembly protein [Brevibacterium aurantiacum]SMX76828.1 TadE-like protein [Brevibacterium aurantiacum]SMX82112.1 TadE-like protein [Brevibacterium aurantiacum]
MSHRRCGVDADAEAEDYDVDREAGADSGSAIAEFALIGSLLALVLAGTLQIGLVIHVRNTVIDSAVAGARQASLADQSNADGKRLTSELITVSVGERYAQSITVTTARHGQDDVVEVRVRTPLPVLGLWGPAEVWDLSGRSIVEDVDRD